MGQVSWGRSAVTDPDARSHFDATARCEVGLVRVGRVHLCADGFHACRPEVKQGFAGEGQLAKLSFHGLLLGKWNR